MTRFEPEAQYCHLSRRQVPRETFDVAEQLIKHDTKVLDAVVAERESTDRMAAEVDHGALQGTLSAATSFPGALVTVVPLVLIQ